MTDKGTVIKDSILDLLSNRRKPAVTKRSILEILVDLNLEKLALKRSKSSEKGYEDCETVEELTKKIEERRRNDKIDEDIKHIEETVKILQELAKEF